MYSKPVSKFTKILKKTTVTIFDQNLSSSEASRIYNSVQYGDNTRFFAFSPYFLNYESEFKFFMNKIKVCLHFIYPNINTKPNPTTDYGHRKLFRPNIFFGEFESQWKNSVLEENEFGISRNKTLFI